MEAKHNNIVGFSVCYVPNRAGRIFANLKVETIDVYEDQDEAIERCDVENRNGRLDELHAGYRVYPAQWVPKGFTLIKKSTK